MRLWPFGKREPEKRESMPFTDAVVAALTAQASGQGVGSASAIAALEAAVALYASAFAAAKVSPAVPALKPSTMALIARDLVRRGESLFAIDVDRGMVKLLPAGSWDVRGPWRESAWWYRLDLFGPSGNVTRFLPGAGVAHFRYAVDPARPWLGISPLGWARATGTLAANLETRLGEEASTPVGHVVTVPEPDTGEGEDDDEDPLAVLAAQLKAMKGGIWLVPSTAAGWSGDKVDAPQRDWRSERLGMDPPAAVASLRSDAGESVLSACGVTVALVTAADGTSQRESWRRFIMGAVEPLLSRVAEEIEVKLETRVTFDLSGLMAHDIQGRAASFKAMVGGGMDIAQAAATAGLMGAD